MAAGSPGSWQDYVRTNQYRQAYGMYMAQQKLGWATDDLRLGEWHGKSVAIQTAEVHGRFLAEGRESAFEERIVNYFSLDGDGEILGGEVRLTTDKVPVALSAVREGNQMKITARRGGQESVRWVPLPRCSLAWMRKLDAWLSHEPSVGAKFDNYSIAWDEDDVNQKETVLYQGAKIIAWGGVKTRVFLVSLLVKGAVMESEMIANGVLVKGRWGGIIELRAEKESLAKQTDAKLVDMLEVSSIKVDTDLGDPEQLSSLTLELTGVDRFVLATSPRQRVVSRSQGAVILELKRDARMSRGQALSASSRKNHLKASPVLQSDHPEIRRLARTIVGQEKDPVKMAGLLQKWVNRNIRQQMAANATSALDVLSQRTGDCTELTTLFLALARAIGLPAREVGGLIFVNEGRPLFGWHAWAEIHDDHQWVSVDPTWNQVYVDATHIKLSEGSDDWSWLNLLRKLQIRVVEAKR